MLRYGTKAGTREIRNSVMPIAESGPRAERGLLPRAQFQALIDTLREAGHMVIGPVREAGAIVYREVTRDTDLPAGWTTQHAPGRMTLAPRADAALFGYVAGAQSFKPYLFRPTRTVWRAQRSAEGFAVEPAEAPPRLAFLGVRACELKAVGLQDAVLNAGAEADADYRARREGLFIVAVNCGTAGGTCFCVSMQSGPRAHAGFDLALTELIDAGRHDFLVEIGSERGAALAARLPLAPAGAADIAAAEAVVAATAQQMGRRLDTDGLKALLQAHPEHPHWQNVAARCLACGNCTAVCPTCFCSTTEDLTSLDGATAERRQTWASCFSLDFTHVHGGAVRPRPEQRYRQWMTHKLAGWVDQFGEFGCVGCGRCITWCPAGIDITAEAAALRDEVARSDQDAIVRS
jgi:sulfhydrogenase subunit beta (sulfur reductase)